MSVDVLFPRLNTAFIRIGLFSLLGNLFQVLIDNVNFTLNFRAEVLIPTHVQVYATRNASSSKSALGFFIKVVPY